MKILEILIDRLPSLLHYVGLVISFIGITLFESRGLHDLHNEDIDAHPFIYRLSYPISFCLGASIFILYFSNGGIITGWTLGFFVSVLFAIGFHFSWPYTWRFASIMLLPMVIAIMLFMLLNFLNTIGL